MVHLYIGDFPYQTDRLPEGTWIFPIFWQVLSRDYHPTARTGTCRLAVENNGKIWCWLVQRGWIFHFGWWNRHNKPTFCLCQTWSPQHFGCSTPPGVVFLNPQSYQIIFLHPWGPGFLRAVGRLFARSKGGKAPGPVAVPAVFLQGSLNMGTPKKTLS